jgi:hypothetical protein
VLFDTSINKYQQNVLIIVTHNAVALHCYSTSLGSLLGCIAAATIVALFEHTVLPLALDNRLYSLQHRLVAKYLFATLVRSLCDSRLHRHWLVLFGVGWLVCTTLCHILTGHSHHMRDGDHGSPINCFGISLCK